VPNIQYHCSTLINNTEPRSFVHAPSHSQQMNILALCYQYSLSFTLRHTARASLIICTHHSIVNIYTSNSSSISPKLSNTTIQPNLPSIHCQFPTQRQHPAAFAILVIISTQINLRPLLQPPLHPPPHHRIPHTSRNEHRTGQYFGKVLSGIKVCVGGS
jgi:hypothetical protein